MWRASWGPPRQALAGKGRDLALHPETGGLPLPGCRQGSDGGSFACHESLAGARVTDWRRPPWKLDVPAGGDGDRDHRCIGGSEHDLVECSRDILMGLGEGVRLPLGI